MEGFTEHGDLAELPYPPPLVWSVEDLVERLMPVTVTAVVPPAMLLYGQAAPQAERVPELSPEPALQEQGQEDQGPESFSSTSWIEQAAGLQGLTQGSACKPKSDSKAYGTK